MNAWTFADPGGALSIFGGTHSHGQGHATVFAQLVHEWLGVPFRSIRYVQGDTAQVAIGRGTYGARSAIVAVTRSKSRPT
jgi:carbon-monoxide dehydrogenase large subunit